MHHKASCTVVSLRPPHKAVDGQQKKGGGGEQNKENEQGDRHPPPRNNNNQEVIIMCLFSFKGLFSVLLLFCLSQGISDGTVLV